MMVSGEGWGLSRETVTLGRDKPHSQDIDGVLTTPPRVKAGMRLASARVLECAGGRIPTRV